MGNAHPLRGRLTPAILLAVLLALAAIATLGLLAGPASAQQTFDTCASCHTSGTTHPAGNAKHTGIGCGTCHTNGTSSPPPPSACASCHGATAVLTANATHTSAPQSCATTDGCHGYVAPPTKATTTLTAKVVPTTVKVGKKVKVTGLAGPAADLAGAKIAFKVTRKVGTKWVKMKAPATATVAATGGSYTWSYKAAKKGSHKVTLTIKATATYTAKTVTKTFKVK